MQLDWYGPYLSPKGQVVLSHHLIAKVIAHVMHPAYRYSTTIKMWYKFDDKVWTKIESVYNTVLSSLEKMRLKLNTRHDKANLVRMFHGVDSFLSGDFVRQVIRDLESNTTLHISDEQFDTHNTYLNTPDGIFNLVNGAN